MKNVYLLLTCFVFAVSGCAPNQSILLDNRAKREAGNTNTSTNTNANLAQVTKKLTVAELMDRVVNAPPDSFLFPCTLNAYSDDDRLKLRKLRQTWLSKERDSRYLVSPSTGCVCPGICVLAVEDTRAAAPNNFALLIIEDLSANKYSWAVKNLDFTNAKLTWASSTPIAQFTNPDGSRGKSCTIEWDKKLNRYATPCSDGNGKTLPSLESE